jgi:hypothetical protein
MLMESLKSREKDRLEVCKDFEKLKTGIFHFVFIQLSKVDVFLVLSILEKDAQSKTALSSQSQNPQNWMKLLPYLWYLLELAEM